VTIDMVQHHRHQHGDMRALHGHVGENFWRMRNQIDHVRADQRRGFWELAITQTEFGIAGEGSGESTAGFGCGQVEPRAIEQPFRQQSSRYGKAEQFEVVAVGDLEWLCCIRKRQVTGRTDLFVTALRGTPQPFELEVDKAKIVRAQGDVRSEAKHGVPGGGDQRYLDRSGINPRNCAFKGLVSDPAWLKPYEGSRKVVSPTSKGLIRTSRLCRPFHEHPKQIAIAKGTPGSQNISLAEKTVNAISARTSMAICQTSAPSTLICLSTAIVVRLVSEGHFVNKRSLLSRLHDDLGVFLGVPTMYMGIIGFPGIDKLDMTSLKS